MGEVDLHLFSQNCTFFLQMALRTLFTLVLIILMARGGSAQTFPEFLRRLDTTRGAERKSKLIDDFFASHPIPFVDRESAYILYRGPGEHVSAPGEFNRWSPSVCPLGRVRGTNLFYRSESLPLDGRAEYKLWVDSTWMLDPANPRRCPGAFGDNSEIRMPEFRPPAEPQKVPGRRRGTIDTVWIKSTRLGRPHPVFIYVPADSGRRRALPLLLVTDGGDYLTYGGMKEILDDLIDQKAIRPIVCAFIDPRTDLADNRTNMRMKEYSADSSYLDFIQQEVVPMLEDRYAVSTESSGRVMIGASMGGLIATYAVLARPKLVSRCAAQSPSYFEADSAVFRTLGTTRTTGAEVYIQTGTIGDTKVEARLVRQLLEQKGARVKYEEFPEGHNWTNWRGKLGKILRYFFAP